MLPDAPGEARWLGAMCFKNGIKRSWRKGRHNSGGVSEAERLHCAACLYARMYITSAHAYAARYHH